MLVLSHASLVYYRVTAVKRVGKPRKCCVTALETCIALIVYHVSAAVYTLTYAMLSRVFFIQARHDRQHAVKQADVHTHGHTRAHGSMLSCLPIWS